MKNELPVVDGDFLNDGYDKAVVPFEVLYDNRYKGIYGDQLAFHVLRDVGAPIKGSVTLSLDNDYVLKEEINKEEQHYFYEWWKKPSLLSRIACMANKVMDSGAEYTEADADLVDIIEAIDTIKTEDDADAFFERHFYPLHMVPDDDEEVTLC